tara:strand:+ start:16249 stop:17361 length:1113 start_codon:yes stop_codon:yes gene_type:complete
MAQQNKINYKTVDAPPFVRISPFQTQQELETDFLRDKGNFGLKWGKIDKVMIVGKSIYRFNRNNIVHSVYDGTRYYKYKGMGQLTDVFDIVKGKKHGHYTSTSQDTEALLVHGRETIRVPQFAKSPFAKDDDDKEEQYKTVLGTGMYNTGRKEGKWYQFYPSGDIKEECFYRLGALDGYKATYEENNVKMQDGFYNNGRPVGEHDTYIDGELVSRRIENGPVNYRIYKYIDGKNVSNIGYKVVTMKVTETYEDKTQKDENGDPVELTRLVDEVRHLKEGKFFIYYGNTKKKTEGEYVADHLHGLIKTYYINGSIHTQCRYVNGLRQGAFTEWAYPVPGQPEKIKIEGNYVKGRRTGTWKFHGDKVYTEQY